jgi:hypothetical protein
MTNYFVPRTQRSAQLFAERCAAEPGPSRTPVLGTVPVLRSGMKNAASRPGHSHPFAARIALSSRDRRALRWNTE